MVGRAALEQARTVDHTGRQMKTHWNRKFWTHLVYVRDTQKQASWGSNKRLTQTVVAGSCPRVEREACTAAPSPTHFNGA